MSDIENTQPDETVEVEETEGTGPRLSPSRTSAFVGIMAKRAARMRNRPLGTYGTEPQFDAIETEPGAEGGEPINIEATPVEPGQEGSPAVVLGPDGEPVPTGDDGIPVLTDDSGVPAQADAPAGEPQGDGDAGTGGSATDDTSEPENGAETGADDPVTDEGYDPSAHTVAEVQEYLDANPDQAAFVLDRERAGKARVTLLGD